MGNKINPIGLRLGIIKGWESSWYGGKDFSDKIVEDQKIRNYISLRIPRGGISKVVIERTIKLLEITIHTARPGVVIGRKGVEADRLRKGIEKLSKQPVKLNIIEIREAELDAQLLARGIADQLENRVAFRRAMKRAVSAALKAGAEGVRVECSGRLGGAEMGRREWYREGRVPLHTLRADIDFGRAAAHTTVGAIGVKVWVYKGDVVGSNKLRQEKISAEANLASGGPAAGRVKSVKSRAEAAVGEKKESKILEAGGGKKSGEDKTSNIVEAGGGKKITKETAQAEFEEEKSILEEE